MLRTPAPWLAVLFVLIGLFFLPKTTLHPDAANELACFYPCVSPRFSVEVGSHRFPLMVMSYLGALKAWLYVPWLALTPATPFFLRLPLLLLGGCNVWLFCTLLARIISPLAAAAGGLLLITDASFVLATSYDFGPIVFLHFSLLAGILLLMRFEKTQHDKFLFLTFLLFGLALWHKMLFGWMLAGLLAAALATFPRRLLALVSPKRVALAAVALCVGALPLLYYNIQEPLATFRLDPLAAYQVTLADKGAGLVRTLNGTGLFGFVTEEDHPPLVPIPSSNTFSGWLTHKTVQLNLALGGATPGWMAYAFFAACLLIPWLLFTGARQATLFAGVYLTVTWLMMLATPKAGATIHHVILLWPLPHFLMAIAGYELWTRFRKPALVAILPVMAVVLGGNLLLLNRYSAHLASLGAGILWTGAVTPLYDLIAGMQGRRFVAVDWGYSPDLCLRSKGALPLEDLSFELLQPSPVAIKQIQDRIQDPRSVFIGHSVWAEQFPGSRSRLDTVAGQMGYSREPLQVVNDAGLRPLFELFTYARNRTAGTDSTTSLPKEFVLDMANREQASRLHGFHGIEAGGWRWTERSFAVELDPIAAKQPILSVELNVPDLLIQRAGVVALSAFEGEARIGGARFSQPGHTQFQANPSSRTSPLVVRFVLDKWIPVGALEGRELGVAVKSIRLHAQ